MTPQMFSDVDNLAKSWLGWDNLASSGEFDEQLWNHLQVQQMPPLRCAVTHVLRHLQASNTPPVLKMNAVCALGPAGTNMPV